MNNIVRIALKEAKELLEHYIDFDEDLVEEEVESVKQFLKALNCGCGCDDYNGFDCGCGQRAFLCKEALKELER